MHYPVISHAYNQGLLQESGFVGTRDYSMFAAVPSAIEFHRTVGSNAAAGAICATESAFDYTHRLITEAALMLTAAWGTKLGQPTDSCGSMMMVGLPPVRSCVGGAFDASSVTWQFKPVAYLVNTIRAYCRWLAHHCSNWVSWLRNLSYSMASGHGALAVLVMMDCST